MVCVCGVYMGVRCKMQLERVSDSDEHHSDYGRLNETEKFSPPHAQNYIESFGGVGHSFGVLF